MKSSLQFKFPVDLTVEQFISKLGNERNLLLVSQQQRLKTYYDSFDWRLYSSGMICEFDLAKLTLKTLKNDLVIASIKLDDVPRFSQQFDSAQVRQQLEPILEMRALLPVCTVVYQSYSLNIINDDQKTILRLIIEAYQAFKPRVLLQPIKGYDKETEDFIQLLSTLGLTATTKPLLLAALKQQGRTVNNYSSKLTINLNPDMRAGVASKLIYSQLLATIKANEQGIIDDIDSEFLHDFRVAVRRTRSALNQLKKVLPDDISAHYAQFFSWLGKITSETRDLDVYLLNFDRYKRSLPTAMREHLNPLHDFLRDKQQLARQELAKQLRSVEYLSTLSEWDQTLKASEPAANAELSIKQLADKRLWKSYQRVLREGNAINDQSPGEALHELRKSCKKLRYLIEFFQSLYPKNKIKMLLKALKELQDVLGNFQDCEVQEEHLKVFSTEMRGMNTPADTFLAIEQLIQNLHSHRDEIRGHFSLAFAAFKQGEIKSLFG